MHVAPHACRRTHTRAVRDVRTLHRHAKLQREGLTCSDQRDQHHEAAAIAQRPTDYRYQPRGKKASAWSATLTSIAGVSRYGLALPQVALRVRPMNEQECAARASLAARVVDKNVREFLQH